MPEAQAQAASLSPFTGKAPAGSVKVSAAPSPAGGAANSASATVTAQAARPTDGPATPTAVTAAAQVNGNNGGTGQDTGTNSGGNQPQDNSATQTAAQTATPPLAGGLASQAPTASAASGSAQTADAASASPQTDSASADQGGSQTQVAPGLLGDPTLIQQVPITAQGAGSANSGAAIPPGMDTRTLALDPATGGTPALTGDVASAATAAATQGVLQTEGPGAANPGTAATGSAFPLSQAAAANPAEQVKVQVSKGLKDGSDSIDVLLHPADLGTVQVKLQMQDGQVKATISADNPQTLALLKNDAHQLTQSLQNAGFNTDSNSLSFQMRGEQQSSGGAFAQQQSGQGGSGSGQGSNSGSTPSPYTTDSEIDEQVLAATSGSGSLLSGLDIKV